MQKGGSQYGVPPPEMATFGGASVTRPPMVGGIPPVEASSPRPVPAPRQSNFEELAATVTGSYQEEDPLLPGGEEVERGISGNRWPRQETMELLKIRSDMDAAFRDATLKGPLWEEVSRKLAEQGYTRSSKKCKEKFENVHKYYKRTKDSRASRPDGKSYRFFSQLEALHNASSSSVPPAASTIVTNTITATANPQPTLAITGARIHQPTPISSIPPPLPPSVPPTIQPMDSTAAAAAAGLSALGGVMSFSSNTSDSESETEDENNEEGAREKRKRKREGSGGGDGGGRGGRGGGSKKMMAFFEGLMKQVIERQEAMQHKFLETIEKREQDRMIREEAWRRQEMARLSREQEAMAQERAKAASRDATIISFLQKITGQAVRVPQTVPVQPTPTAQPTAVVQNAQAAVPQPPSPTPPPPQPPQLQHSNLQQTPPQSQPQANLQPQQQQQPQSQPHIHPQQQQLQPPPPPPTQPQYTPPPRQLPQPESGAKTASMEIALPARQELLQLQFPQEPEAAAQAMVVASNTSDIASSRWPKAEVHALINIRAGMESKYQEAVPKGPLWEEISTSMKQLGYNRNAKRCKEKWENINKYFKKVKESNKKRPDDAKTCPYFHQLDALYRNKVLGGGGGGGGRVGGALAITGGSSGSVDGRSQQQDPDPSVLPITTLPRPISNSTTGDGNSNKPVVSPNATSTEVALVAAPPAATQALSSNGGLPPPTSFVQDKANATTDLMKKPEDIVKEFMEQRQHPRYDYDGMAENTEDDDVDDDDDDDDGMDEEEQKMAYKIEFQRPSIPPSTTPTSNVNGNKATASTTGSFLAMVHQ